MRLRSRKPSALANSVVIRSKWSQSASAGLGTSSSCGQRWRWEQIGQFSYANRTGRPSAPLVRILARTLPGVGFVQRQPGFTAYLHVEYRKPTPLNRPLELKGWIDKIEGRKRFIRGTCHLDGELLTEANGLFIAPREGGYDYFDKLGVKL